MASSPESTPVENRFFDQSLDASTWAWAFPCPVPSCSCRSALVVSAGSREELVERATPIATAWRRNQSHREVAAQTPSVSSFLLNMDSGEVEESPDLSPSSDKTQTSEVLGTAELFTGEHLDELARLWYSGKGLRMPIGPAEADGPIELDDWQPGEHVAWDELFASFRRDVFVDPEAVVEATELYCSKPGCRCEEAIIQFDEAGSADDRFCGYVQYDAKTGRARLNPDYPDDRGLLERLWAKYSVRHPDLRMRVRARRKKIASLVERLRPTPSSEPVQVESNASQKVGRNSPCPCGSGKKYKKCCGQSS